MAPRFAYFGHHKCASTWIEHICGSVCYDLGLQFRIVYKASDVQHDLAGYFLREPADFLAYANADYEQVRPLGEVRGFHVVRDPRDIVVSAYFSHLHSHPTQIWPELAAHREQLKVASREEGLFLEMDFRAQQFAEMRSWPDEPSENILSLRMEEFTADPPKYLIEIFSFLGLLDEGEYTAAKRTRFFLSKAGARLNAATGIRAGFLSTKRLPAERLLGIEWENRFSRKTKGRAKGEEDVKSHYRKGTAGDWINHFNRKHLEYFRERYSDLVIKYGYETDPDWHSKYEGRLAE